MQSIREIVKEIGERQQKPVGRKLTPAGALAKRLGMRTRHFVRSFGSVERYKSMAPSVRKSLVRMTLKHVELFAASRSPREDRNQ